MGNCLAPTNSGGKNNQAPASSSSSPVNALEVKKRSKFTIRAVVFGAKGSGKSTLLKGTFPARGDNAI